jgi:hypothetical protein
MCAGAVGCKPARFAVSGNVTLDGQAVSEAVILFVPLQTNTKKTGGVIANGKYEIAAEVGLLPGAYRVEILDDPPHGAPATARRPFPQHYSHNSPLQAEVTADSTEAKFDFPLKLNPNKP